MTAEEQGGGADPHGQAAGSPALPSNAEIGQRIAAILDAAEASAEKIRATARDEAAAIVRNAHETAAQRVADLTREPERLRDEAAADAADLRQRADHDAREMLETAQRESSSVRNAATEEVRALTEVRNETATAVFGAIAGLREVAQRLEADVLTLVDPDVAAEQRSNRPWSSFLRRDGQRPASVNGSGETVVKNPSDDLYERAKELRIRGRSKMNRDELEAAVQQQTPVERD